MEESIAGAAARPVEPLAAKLVVEDWAAHLALVRNLASRNKGR